MSKIYHSLTELVGNTPLLEIKNIEAHLGLKARVLVKLELFNPGGSVKDRDSGPLPERPCRTVLRHTGGKQLRLFGVENHPLEHHMRLPEKVGTAAVPVTQKPGPYLVFLLRRRLAGKVTYQQI